MREWKCIHFPCAQIDELKCAISAKAFVWCCPLNEPTITKLSWDIQHIIGSSLGFVCRCRWSPARWHPWSLTSPNWSIYRPKKEGDEATSSCHCSLRPGGKRCGFRRWCEISGFKKLGKNLDFNFSSQIESAERYFRATEIFHHFVYHRSHCACPHYCHLHGYLAAKI